MKCEICNNELTLLLTKYVCDWCDGIVEKEWIDNEKTDPLLHEIFKFDVDDYGCDVDDYGRDVDDEFFTWASDEVDENA